MTIKEIASRGGGFVISIDHNHLDKMIEFESYKGSPCTSHYLHADGWPFGTHENLVKLLNLYGVQSHIYTTGGHAYAEAITKAIEVINPKKVIPLHGITPSALNTKGREKILPIKGETLILS